MMRNAVISFIYSNHAPTIYTIIIMRLLRLVNFVGKRLGDDQEFHYFCCTLYWREWPPCFLIVNSPVRGSKVPMRVPIFKRPFMSGTFVRGKYLGLCLIYTYKIRPSFLWFKTWVQTTQFTRPSKNKRRTTNINWPATSGLYPSGLYPDLRTTSIGKWVEQRKAKLSAQFGLGWANIRKFAIKYRPKEQWGK